MYEGRAASRLRRDLLNRGRENVVATGAVLVWRVERIDRVRAAAVTSFGGSLKQGPLVGTPGDLLASPIVTMRHVVLIAHGNLFALVASEFQATADVGRDETLEATLVQQGVYRLYLVPSWISDSILLLLFAIETVASIGTRVRTLLHSYAGQVRSRPLVTFLVVELYPNPMNAHFPIQIVNPVLEMSQDGHAHVQTR